MDSHTVNAGPLDLGMSETAADREMHVVAAIEEWNRTMPLELLRQKCAMMAESPLSFFCGTNHLFWADFSGDERLMRFGSAHTSTWIVADCTVNSFCASGNEAEGPWYGLKGVFEEALIADYQYDVWRLATSVVLLWLSTTSAAPRGTPCLWWGLSSWDQGKQEETGNQEQQQQQQEFEEAANAAVCALARQYLRAVVGYKPAARYGGNASEVKITRAGGSTGSGTSWGETTGAAAAASAAGVADAGGGQALDKSSRLKERPHGLSFWGGGGSSSSNSAGLESALSSSSSPSLASRLSSLLSLAGGNEKSRLVRFLGLVERENSRRRLLRKWCATSSTQGASSSSASPRLLHLPGRLDLCPSEEFAAVASALPTALASGSDPQGPLAEALSHGQLLQLRGVELRDLRRWTGAEGEPGRCGVPRYLALVHSGTISHDGTLSLHLLDICLIRRPTAYHFMSPDERRGYREALGGSEGLRYCSAACSLAASPSPSSDVPENTGGVGSSLDGLGARAGVWFMELKDGVHPLARGAYSVRDISPFEEPYPAHVHSPTSSSRPKFRDFALTTKESLMELSEDWGRVLGTQHAHAAAMIARQRGTEREQQQQQERQPPPDCATGVLTRNGRAFARPFPSQAASAAMSPSSSLLPPPGGTYSVLPGNSPSDSPVLPINPSPHLSTREKPLAEFSPFPPSASPSAPLASPTAISDDDVPFFLEASHHEADPLSPSSPRLATPNPPVPSLVSLPNAAPPTDSPTDASNSDKRGRIAGSALESDTHHAAAAGDIVRGSDGTSSSSNGVDYSASILPASALPPVAANPSGNSPAVNGAAAPSMSTSALPEVGASADTATGSPAWATEKAAAATSGAKDSVREESPPFGSEILRLAKADRGGFEALVWQVARSYSQQVVRDWAAFKRHL